MMHTLIWINIMIKKIPHSINIFLGTKKKKKRVVKRRVPKALIDLKVVKPLRSVEDLTPVQLAKRSPIFRQYYALTTFIDAKLRGYEQALIRQYNPQGYAEDEIEVTDNDSEEEEEEN
ncbi:hypothetical protein C2845_PM13G00760 [Panicum miliaceum]|uniref:Uncharacterized protein n=1 Tax=Panicum miliaceum TaxID=4540 RepID=A0A3L6RF99_PANMI|nr:hypothetical protein C2845_PM13G00760 [Panicum miliaceum]